MYRKNVSVDIQIYIYIDSETVKSIIRTTWGLCPRLLKTSHVGEGNYGKGPGGVASRSLKIFL